MVKAFFDYRSDKLTDRQKSSINNLGKIINYDYPDYHHRQARAGVNGYRRGELKDIPTKEYKRWEKEWNLIKDQAKPVIDEGETVQVFLTDKGKYRQFQVDKIN